MVEPDAAYLVSSVIKHYFPFGGILSKVQLLQQTPTSLFYCVTPQMISKANSRRWNTLGSVSMYRVWNKTAICGGRLGRESASHCFGSTPAVCPRAV